MRKFFTRLLLMVTLLSVISLVSVAQSWTSPKLTPVDGACTVLKTGQIFTIDFGEAVMPVKGGKISLNASDGTQLYPIQFDWSGTNPPANPVFTSSIGPYGTVSFTGNKVVIDFKATLTEKANYYITVYPGAIKRASSGATWNGIGGTAPDGGSLSCINDYSYGWDFTVGDFTAPYVKAFWPLDEAKDVDPIVVAAKGIYIVMNENMTWAKEGMEAADLAPGDIALYTTTDPILGQYGGDVIFTKPSDVQFSGDTIKIFWPNQLPKLTNMYVRINNGLFAEVQCTCSLDGGQTAPKTWSGINTNGTGPGGVGNNLVPWNFTTKDTRVPEVKFSRDNCTDTSKFYIILDENKIVTAGMLVPVNNTNIDAFVEFNGGPFDAKVSSNGITTITIDPVNKLVSGATVTVKLKAGLWDASHNPIPAAQCDFTNGDYLPPVYSMMQTIDEVGTSFDLLTKWNEKATVFYIVVKKSDVMKSGVEFYKPTLNQVDTLANIWDNVNNPLLPGADLYNDSLTVNRLTSYVWKKNGATKTVNVWAAGKFNVPAGDVDVLERIADLPRTDNSTEYLVYAFAIDQSECGEYNQKLVRYVNAAPTIYTEQGWITSLYSISGVTTDVLPPRAIMTGAFVADTANNKCQVTDYAKYDIKRNGPITITFNEAVKLADGNPITPASLENIFILKNNNNPVGINTTTSSIDATNKIITLYPDSAFKSDSYVEVILLGNKVEDLAGNEKNYPDNKYFCVESYCEPLISWTADKVDYPTSTAIKENQSLSKTNFNSNVEVTPNGTIQVKFNQVLYATSDNEPVPGTLQLIVNDSTKLYWVGRYIKVRESTSGSWTTGPSGALIYSKSDNKLGNFDIAVAYPTSGGDKTIITIEPKGNVFKSEMWYNVEVEGMLQNAERLTILQHLCYTEPAQINHVWFQATDSQAPTVMFFQADSISAQMNYQFNSCTACNTPTLNVPRSSRIGVKITEWVELGFDGFRDLLATQTVPDANALRRYFEVRKCSDNSLVNFDVEDFSRTGEPNDTAYMYIDPYYPPKGEYNFIPGETYTVKFISNALESGYGPGAFADKHGNIMSSAESCFKIYKYVAPTTCFASVAVGKLATGPCAGAKNIMKDLANFSLAMNFSTAMKQNGTADPAVVVYKLTLDPATNTYTNNGTLFGTNFDNLLVSNSATTFTMNSTNCNDVTPTVTFDDNTRYYIAVKKEVFMAIDDNATCTKWPAANAKPKFNLASDYVIVDSLNTIDSTFPDIVSLYPVDGGIMAITDSLTIYFNDNVYPVAGQVLEVFEYGTNTRIARIDVGGLNPNHFTWLTIPNSYFNTFLEYNKRYYVQFNAGLVKDECGNASTDAFLSKDDWDFTIGPNPAPDFAKCGESFTPSDEANYYASLTPTFKIRFTEPVEPVANKKIDLYEGVIPTEIAIAGNWYATQMTATSSAKTEWMIQFSSITHLSPSLNYGNCYHVNIEAGAFKEVVGSGTTPRIVSFETANSGALTTCTWDFCVKDLDQPKVTYWPEKASPNKISIPLNAYLFAKVNEPVMIVPAGDPMPVPGKTVTSTIALIPENAASFFKLQRYVSGTSPTWIWDEVPFKLEFVGNNKQRMMFTPLDPAAPDFTGNQNPTMDDNMRYRLLNETASAYGTLIDGFGNEIKKDTTYFYTEDIICPAKEGTKVKVTGPTSISGSGFKFKVKLPENGDIYYTIKNTLTGEVVKNKVAVTGLKKDTDKEIEVKGINATEASQYNFIIDLRTVDDEQDLYDSDTEIAAQWPVAEWAVNYARLRDLRKAPNACDTLGILKVRLCDDDAPQIVAQFPAKARTDVETSANVTFTLDQYVLLETTHPSGHNFVWLRDYENNLSVSATVTLDTIMVGSTVLPNRKVVINPVAPLWDQHKYYVEIERYAVKDTAYCSGTLKVNYLAEHTAYTEKDWWWFKTKDNTPPDLLCSGTPTGSCIGKNTDITITVQDGNAVTTNWGEVPFIDIYEVGESIPHERISTRDIVPSVSGDKYTFTFPTRYFYLSGEEYEVRIPAKTFIDTFGNKSTEACSWTFFAEDFEAPVATWKVVEDFSYMYNVRTDPYYEREYEHGDAGEVLTGIPTSSFFYVKFHEPVQFLNTKPDPDTWPTLDSAAAFDLNLIAQALKVTNVTTGQVLQYNPTGYGSGYYILNDYYHPDDRFKVIIIDDWSHMGYSGAQQWSGSYDYPFGSMMSNATYKIELLKDRISDIYSTTCKTRNIISEDILLVTATTRNDVPPTLTMKDANGAVICDPDCNKDWTLTNWWQNMTQPNNWSDHCCDNPSDSVWWNWGPEWPGIHYDKKTDSYIIDNDTLCNVCVAEGDHITLEFDKKVVKTPVELINMSPFWWEGNGVQWWTEANLGLWPDGRDFARADDPSFKSRFIKFQRFVTEEEADTTDLEEGWVDVPLARAEVIDDRIIKLYWDSTLYSEGIYAITFAPYTVKDVIRVPDGNEFLGMTCTFRVKDHQEPIFKGPEFIGEKYRPCVASWLPYPSDIDTTVQLAMLFNEPVQPGKPGKKLIIRRENGQQQQIIDVSQITIDERDSINGVANPFYLRRVYINNGNFEENTLYYVEVQPEFIADRGACGINYWDGIDPEDSAPGWQALIPSFEWVFKTGDNTPPEPILLSPNRRNDVSRETDLMIIFDENVSTNCTCDNNTGPHANSAPMTWNEYDMGAKGFYIYADNGATPSVEFGNFVEFIPWDSPQVKITGTDIYNGLTHNKVIIDPYTTFKKNMTYYVRVSDSIYCDGFMNVWDGIGDSTTWKFTITNDVAPEISWTSPSYEKMDDPDVTGDYPQTVAEMPNGYAITDLKMAFVDEDNHEPLAVKKGAGNIKIFEYIYNPLTFSYEEKLWKSIPITDPSVEIWGPMSDTVIVHNVKLLDDVNLQNCVSPRMYYVTVEPGAITNGYQGSLTYWVGFNDAFDWRFYTAPDNTFMPYTIVKPLGTNMTIPAASTLQMTFAENIEAMPGTAKVKIYKKTGDVLVDEFDPVAANISGNILTLLTTKLVDETEYYVLVEAGAVGDTSTCSTPFPGILDKTVWTFSTGDNTAPVPALATTLGTCEKPCVTVKFTFNETFGVTPSAGRINILKGGVVFASQPAAMGANMNEITATFCSLPDTTVFTIAFEADVVKDNGNNHISNVAVANLAWTFKTADNTAPALTEWLPVVNNAEKSVTISVKASEVVDKVAGKKVTIANGTANLVFDVNDMVTADGGKTWTKVVDNLLDKTTYTVTVEAGAFKDKSCAPNPTALATTWTFTTDDNAVPTVIPVKPVQDEILGTYRGLSITFNLSEPVKAGTGNITITRGTNVVSLPVGTDKVVIDATGTKVTLVTPDMLYFGQVTVKVPAGAFMDMAINPNGNPEKVWFFWITDTSIAQDCMTIMSPIDGAQCVLRNTDLIMKFCEWMAPGDQDKKLRVYEILEIPGQLDQNKEIFRTSITLSMINHDIVMVSLTGLKDYTGYTVMIDYDAIRDEAGNKWEGISDPVKWNFRTGDNTAPYVVNMVPASPVGNLKNNFDVIVNFSEKVIIPANGIMVENAAKAPDITTTDSISWKIAVNALDMAAVKITVKTVITDKVQKNCIPNPLVAEVVGTYTVGDNTAPTVAITSQPADKTNTPRNFNVVLTFSEKVSGVAAALAGSTGYVGVTSTDDIVYTVAMSGADETQVKLVLDKTKVKDVSLNQNVLKDGVSETYMVGDWAVPTATVDPAAKSDIRDAVFNVKVKFSEDVIVPATGGFVVTGGTLGTPTNVGLEWTLPITAKDGANVKLELNSTITDDSKNKNPLAYAAYPYQFGDRTAPWVEIVSPATNDMNVNTFNVLIRFSESVKDVNTTNVTLTGKRPVLKLTEVVPGLAYEATLTGADGDKLTLNFSDGIKDLAGNKLVQPAAFIYNIADTKAPTVVANPSSGLNLERDNEVLLKFSEDVLNVSTGVTVTGAKTSAVTMVKDSLYKVVFNAVDLALVKITVGATVVDLKGNAIVPVTFMYEIGDHVKPTVEAVPATDPNAKNKWDVVLTFSEPVNVPAGAITVTGAESFTLDAVTHKVSIVAKDGAVVKLSLSDAITDKSLNANKLVPVSFTYTVGDNTAPTVTAVGPVPANNTVNKFNVTLTFSEEVTGVAAALAGSTGVTGVTPSADGKVYVVAMEGLDLTKLKLVLDKALVKDVSANKNPLAEGLSLDYTVGDHVAPTAVVDPASADKAKNKWNVTITFSEAVNVPAGAISVTGGKGTVTNVGNVYTVAIEAADLATVTLDIANSIADVSLNANKFAGAQYTYKVGDNTPPTVKVIPPTAKDTLNTFNVDIIFSEPVTGVTNANVYLEGGTTSNGLIELVPGLAYRKDVAGADKTTVKLILSDAIKDLAGNSLGKQTFTYTIGDHVAPTLLSASPASGTANLKNETKVKLTFSEDVLGVPAAITVNKGTVVTTGTGAVYEAVITAPDLTNVIVTISNAVTDVAGNKFAGATLNYTVGDNTAPKLVTWTPNGTTTEDNHPVFVMTFDENVVAGDGSLYVYQEGVAGAFVTVPVTAAMVNGKVVTVVYDAKTNGALDKSTKYYVLVDAGALKDASGNKFAGVADKKAWTFTTGPKFATSATDLNAGTEFKVYPNPFNGYVQIQNNDKLTRVTITNIAGQRVMDVQYPERIIRTENLVSGVYVITLFTQDGIAKSERIVKR